MSSSLIVVVVFAVMVVSLRGAVGCRSPASAESKSRTQRRNYDRAATSAYKGAMIAEDW